MFGLFGGSQRDIYGDQAGLSGGFGGGRGGDISNTLLMAGLGLMSSPRNNPMEGVLKGVTAGMALDERGGDKAAHKRALYMAYRASGMDHQRAALLAEAGDSSIGKLLLDQENKAKARKYLDQDQVGGAPDIYGGGTGGGSSAPSSAPRTVPSGPRMLPMPSSPSTSDSPLAPSSHVAPAEPQQSVAGGDPITQYAEAIAAKESGGRYGAVGPTHPKLGRALGKYQVMEANVGPWTQAALGKRMTGDEFLESPEAQDAVFRHRFGGYAEKHGPEGAASMWFTGRPHAPGAKDVLGTTGANYVASFRNNLARLGGGKPQQVASADSSFMPGPLSEEEAGLAPSSDPVAETKARTGVDWNNPVARQHMIDAGLTPPGGEAAPSVQPGAVPGQLVSTDPRQAVVPGPIPGQAVLESSLDPATQKIKAQYDAQIKELLGTGQIKKAEQLEAMRDSSMAQRMPAQPSAPSPQPAPPIGPQVASADAGFVPATNPAAPQDTSGVSYTEQVQRGTPAAQVAQAPTGTMTDAPRMVKTTRERPMGAPPAQAQASPEAGQTPAFIMRRRAILQQAQNKQHEALLLERRGLKAASEVMKDEIKFLYDQAKPSDVERQLIAAGVPPGSRQWEDALRRNVDDKRPTDIQTYEYARDNPDFLKYQKEQNEAKSTKLNVNTAEGFATEQKKAKMKLDLEMAQDIGKQALAGRRLLPLLNEVERLADKTPAGWAGPVAAEAAKAFAAVGIEVPQGWSNAELLQSISQRLVPIVREPGPTSEKELKIYVKAVPGLMQSADGRKKVVVMTRAIVERANDIAKVYRQNLGADDLHDKLAALDKPIIPDAIRDDIERLGGESAGAAIPPGAAEKLKKNPSLRKDFDEKYGAGSADRVLGR
jgi:hypothetical protein